MIKINSMSFSYEKSSPAVLSNINLDIPKGTYLSILGENGSCKTTLIKLILGLLSPDSGSININTKNIGYVPQKVDSFNSDFPISICEILKVHGNALKLNVKDSMNYVLNKVNMIEFKDKLIGNLSGGQRQRIFIAKALMGNPDLIILDEPSTGVDFKNQIEIYNLLNTLNNQEKTTIISIEHNLETALKYSTHILKIDEGILSLKSVNEFKEELQMAGA